MADRKTVMSWLEGLTWDDWSEWHSDSEVREMAKAALELLKEQEEQIKIKTENFNRLVAKIEVMPEVVRCLYCKHSKPLCRPWLDIVCTKSTAVHDPDWFCADGERRDTDG